MAVSPSPSQLDCKLSLPTGSGLAPVWVPLEPCEGAEVGSLKDGGLSGRSLAAAAPSGGAHGSPLQGSAQPCPAAKAMWVHPMVSARGFLLQEWGQWEGVGQHREYFCNCCCQSQRIWDAFKLLLPKRRKVYCCFRGCGRGLVLGFLFISLRLRMLVQ